MSEFDRSRWTESEFAQEYREFADGYVPERHRLVEITRSLYRHFLKGSRPRRVLDLGCGDGLFVAALQKTDAGLDATLVDGSAEMLEAARQRLAGVERTRFVLASFQELLAGDPLETTFDFALSSLAIHHLRLSEKEALYEYVFSHLDPGGVFVNIDVVLSPTPALEDWYLGLWREWIAGQRESPAKAHLLTVPQRYKDNPDNIPDTLLAQLQALERVGFKSVDCYYKYGVFAMFGGTK